MVAQELALAHPDRVESLVLASTSCGGPNSRPAERGALRRLAEPNMAGDRELAMRAAWELNMSAAFAANDDVRRQFLELGRTRKLKLTVLGAQMQASAGHDTSARLGALTMPTLVIHGTNDELLPVANGELIARLIRGATLQLLPGAGHMFFWEMPQRAAQLIGDFVSAHDRGDLTAAASPSA